MGDLVIQFLSLLALVALACATAAGVMLVVAPARAARVALWLDRRFSLVGFEVFINRNRPTERFIYRYHRPVGVFLTLGPLLFLWRAATVDMAAAMAALWGAALPPALALAVMEAVCVTLTAGAVVGVAAGVVVFLRPSLLKQVERWANRWLSTDEAAANLDRYDDRLDHLLWRHPRLVGVVVLVVVAYIAATAAAVVG